MFDATRNKSNVLFSVTAGHLDDLLLAYGQKKLVIICDRQGGRGHYGPMLRLMFDEWLLEIVSEVESRSEYRLIKGGHSVRIVFVEKAETQCMPVALASMLSKYLREAMMHRFNVYWRRQLPGIIPTAGYHTDGMRFLGDIQHKRRELGVAGARRFVRDRCHLHVLNLRNGSVLIEASQVPQVAVLRDLCLRSTEKHRSRSTATCGTHQAIQTDPLPEFASVASFRKRR